MFLYFILLLRTFPLDVVISCHSFSKRCGEVENERERERERERGTERNRSKIQGNKILMKQ